MSAIQSTMGMTYRTGRADSADWGPAGRAAAAIAYLFTVGIVFTSVTGAILYLLG